VFFALVEVVGAQRDGVLDIQDHIGRIWAASQTLSAMGRPLGNEFLAFLLLHSLPHKDSTWDTFRTTILNAIPVVAAPAPGVVATAPLLTFNAVETRLIAQVNHNLQTSTKSALKASTVLGSSSRSGTMRTSSSTARTLLNKQPPPSGWLMCSVHGQCSHTSANCRSLKARKKEKDQGSKPKGKSQLHSIKDGDDSSSSSDKSAHAHHVLVGKHVMKNLCIYSARESTSKREVLIANTGATSHIIPHLLWFSPDKYHTFDTPRRIHFGNETYAKALGIGEVRLGCTVGSLTNAITLTHVLYVLSFTIALVSVHHLCQAGIWACFSDTTCHFHLNGETVMNSYHCRNLYHI
jgi:hypothetical protein